jgi:AhpC/TSA family protein
MLEERVMSATSAPGARLAAGGLVVVIAGIVSYFAAVMWLPSRPEIRNTALPNWLIVAAGAAMAAAGARRAITAPAGTRRRWLGPTLAGVDLALVAAFGWLLYVGSTVEHVPGPAIGAPAPDFALAAQDGRRVRLADFHGRPVLLVFYRGHW